MREFKIVQNPNPVMIPKPIETLNFDFIFKEFTILSLTG